MQDEAPEESRSGLRASRRNESFSESFFFLPPPPKNHPAPPKHTHTSVTDRGAWGTHRKELRMEMGTPGLSTCSKLITWVTCSNHYSSASLNFNFLSGRTNEAEKQLASTAPLGPNILTCFSLFCCFLRDLAQAFGMQDDVIKWYNRIPLSTWKEG